MAAAFFQHNAIAAVDADMGDGIAAVVCIRKENQISGFCFTGRNRRAVLIVNSLRSCVRHVLSGFRENVADKAGTVHGFMRRIAAQHIRCANQTFSNLFDVLKRSISISGTAADSGVIPQHMLCILGIPITAPSLFFGHHIGKLQRICGRISSVGFCPGDISGTIVIPL